MRGLARHGTRRVTASTAMTPSPALTSATVPAATMLGAASRILVRLILARFGALGARRVSALGDLELRRHRELNGALQQLLDVTQQRRLVG